jgi:hypothetical protein
MNFTVAALRFFFTYTLDRPDLARKLIRIPYPRKLPTVLAPDEVARLLAATTCLKHRAALSVAYGAGLRVAEVASLNVATSLRIAPCRSLPWPVSNGSSMNMTCRDRPFRCMGVRSSCASAIVKSICPPFFAA